MPENATESVWDYPRPPRLERTDRRLRVVHAGHLLADSTHAWRIVETSHPPVFYLPPEDIATQCLVPSTRRRSLCEFKGLASYWDIDLSSLVPGSQIVREAAWSYPDPAPAYEGLRNHLAFYASRVDECTVDGERVAAQPGDFYGGWITSHVRGPFKGPPGTLGW